MNRGGPPTTLAEELAAAAVLARAREIHGAPPPPREPGCDDGDDQDAQAPGEAGHHDAGTDPGQHADGAGAVPAEAAPAPAPAPPAHAPRYCSSCNAQILWAALLDDAGQRIRRDDDKGWKSIPVNFSPDPVKGNIALYHREGEGIVCRVLKKGEAPPTGARLRTSHFSDCPNAHRHRRKSR
jgi:hypothetical protein